MLAHYLLLYNLSMISRYETEWWYELLHTYSSKDYPFILRFLEVTAQKIPYLISCYLNEHTKRLAKIASLFQVPNNVLLSQGQSPNYHWR